MSETMREEMKNCPVCNDRFIPDDDTICYICKFKEFNRLNSKEFPTLKEFMSRFFFKEN